jgi:hypothetical protein
MAPDRTTGLQILMPFGGGPMHHLLSLKSVARPGARGVRPLQERKVSMSRLLWLALATLSLGLFSIGALARDPSTPEERKQAIQYVRNLETDPLSKDASQERKWLLTWIREVPDIAVTTCVPLVSPLLNSEYAYKSILSVQLTFSTAAYVIEHPEKMHDIQASSLAGLEGVLAAYQSLIKAKPDAKQSFLDELLAKRAEGKLAEFVASNCK